MTNDSERFMRRAIELSINGFPAPNPHVGCVIVKNGEIVGEGFHDHAGGPHAEVVALQQAGEKARGADVYVTLEPCNHTGRTPPCSNALINAGVASVRIATVDFNPKATGGMEALRDAGIGLMIGILEEEAYKVNEQFLTAMRRATPYVVGKVAMSLDGRVSLPNGESKWITNEDSRAMGHRLRAECGAVLVGRNTVVRDNPLLTARVDGVVNQPTRIVLDPNSALSGMEKVFGDEAPTIHVVKQPLHERQLQAPMNGNEIDLPALLKSLFDRGITGILIEGGPITLGHFLKQGLLDRLEVFVAPKALGSGPAWVQLQVDHLANAYALDLRAMRQLGSDIWLTYQPIAPMQTAG